MAITKLGARLMSLEKTALAGKEQSRAPSLWKRVGHGLGRANSFAMPAMMAVTTSAEIASGQNSLGGGLGELGGGLAGYSLGSKVMDGLARNVKPNFLKGALGVGAGLVASGLGASIGSGLGNAILPFRRKPQTYDSWINANGGIGRPEA